MSMTATIEPTAKKRGRPFGSFGAQRRQKELVVKYTNALGGPSNVTPWERRDIERAVVLQAIAEERRRQINEHDGPVSSGDYLALVQLEEFAEAAVDRLRLPCHRGFHPKEDFK